MKVKFKEDFSFGAAMSGGQTEGNKGMGKTTWDLYYEEDPNSFYDNIGPKITTNSYEQYPEDVKIAKEIGLRSIRTSIQWARVINLETGEVNQEGIEFYRNYFKAYQDAGVDVFVGVSHFDIPKEIHEKYEGFYSRETIDLFVNYVEICFKELSSVVTKWVTFNEPYSYSSGCYLRTAMLPLEYNFGKHFITSYHILIAHKKCVELFESMDLKAKYGCEIGIVLDAMVPYPRDPKNEFDQRASYYADLVKNRSFLDPVLKGEISQDYLDMVEMCECELPIMEGDLELIAKYPVDFVGINYYRPERVKGVTVLKHPDAPWGPEHLYNEFVMPKSRQNKHRGWEIYPKALYDVAMRMKNDYGNIKWYVSENGMGVEEENAPRIDGIIQDDYRIDFVVEHLYWLQKAIEDGSNCFGYHLWTFIDNWSWRNAYKNRYGYIELDLKTRERKFKKSAFFMKEVISTNELDVSKLFEIE